MTTIKTRPGNPNAIVPYGYLVLTDEDGGVNEEPISHRALVAIEEHFAMLRGLHETVSREIVRTGWTITPEHGLGRMLVEISAMLGVGPWDSPPTKEEAAP
jgi:hypothetical protein